MKPTGICSAEGDGGTLDIGHTSIKGSSKQKPSEKEIDQNVVAQANDDSAWEKPVCVVGKQSLKKLVSHIPENHKTKEVDWGKPVGGEAW
jgi:hypothetical protein